MSMRTFCRLVLVLLGATPGNAAEPEHRLLFDSGRDGYGRYRIPSLVVAPGGTVLAICEGRKNGRGLTGDIDLIVRSSQDSGKTWSSLRVLADDGDNTLGNPCALVDATTKEVWVGLTRSLGSDTEEQIVAGTSQERTRVLVTKSSDDGATWSPPVDISSTARKANWTWYGTGPGIGIQMKRGRLVMPSYHAEVKTGVYCSHMVYSDDHGKSWKLGETVGKQCSECQVVERSNGDLILDARTIEGRDRRTTARSTDGGATWTDVRFHDDLYDSNCQACLMKLPATDKDLPPWLFTHPAGPGRRNLTVRLSRDEGRSWPSARKLRDGDSQYTSVAKLPDGSLGCLYDCWADGNYRLFFVRFDESWVTGG